jgi:Mrp family chromosome partitioning ATPase
LVDANPGRQSLSAWFGLEHAAGLSDGLKQSGDWVGLVQAQIRPGLDLLCGGRQIMHPKDLWTHPRWAPLLSELANGYDHVVIDGPTGVNLLGAKEVLPRMSGIFVVARRLRTRENDLIEMVRQLQGLGGHVSRVVFNESTLARAD